MTKVRRLWALMTVWALMLGLTGCSQTAAPPEESSAPSPPAAAEEEETKIFALGYAGGDTLHPLETDDRSNLDVSSLVYEGLYRLDENFDPQPCLAVSAQVSEDGMTWTLALREDAAFSNGTLLTADIAARSLNAARKAGSFAPRLGEVAGVSARDGLLVITLLAPNGNLPALLDVPIVLEQEEGLPLGTGPYAFDRGEDGLLLAANPNWWQGRIPLYSTIPLRENQTLEERVSDFDSGGVTALTTDFTAANALGYSGVYETHDFTTTNLLFVGFNTVAGFCTDSQLRTALSRAFDRGTVVTGLLSGHGVAAELPMYPGSSQYSSQAASLLAYDLEGARALLETAGYTYGGDGELTLGKKTVTLTLLVCRDSPVKQSVADHLARDLGKLGIGVTVSSLDWADYSAALEAGSFDLYLGEVKLTGDFDITALVRGGLNYGGYAGEQVTALLAEWKAGSGHSREEAARALYLAMAEDLPFAALCFKKNSLLVRWGLAEPLTPLREAPFYGIENWRSVK